MKKITTRRRHHPYASLKNKKRATRGGGRQAAATGRQVGFQYSGSGIVEALMARLIGSPSSQRGR